MCVTDVEARAVEEEGEERKVLVQRRPQQSNVLLRLTICFVIVTTFTTALLFLVLRQSNKQAALLSESVSALSLSSQQTQVLLQQQTQQLEHIKQQNEQQQEENDLSSKNKNNIKSTMSRKDSDKNDKNNNEEKYDEEHSCLSSNFLFCERMVRVSHKMGYILGHSLFQHTPGVTVKQSKRVSDGKKKDYRDVLIVRNMYEAIVSGYLYHKSGRECHLSPNGEPWHPPPGQNSQINVLWDKHLVETQEKVKQFVGTTNNTFKSNNNIIDVHKTRPNQTMCQFLQETAESGGKQGVELAMLTYMHNVFKIWYMNLFTNLDRVVGTIGNDNHRTLLVCFEELEDPEQKPHVVQTILHFLFPANDTAAALGGRGQQQQQTRKRKRPPPKKAYSGGHATDHDPQVRAALKDIIRKLDVEYFDGVIAKYQAIIGCTSR